MTYHVRVTFRSGDVIQGITDTHPRMEVGTAGEIVTIRLTTNEWMNGRHVAVKEWDTIVNMADVVMVQCRQVTE